MFTSYQLTDALIWQLHWRKVKRECSHLFHQHRWVPWGSSSTRWHRRCHFVWSWIRKPL